MLRALPWISGIVAIGALPALAGPENVEFPVGYGTNFVRYATVDKPDRDPPIVRFLYVNQAALAGAEAGEPLPYGTVIVMEDHPAELDDTGAPVTREDGRFVPSPEVGNVFVQAKGEGWGAEYPDAWRNGEWEYAWFNADGSRREDASFQGCFECHKGVEGQDYNFTLSPFVADIK